MSFEEPLQGRLRLSRGNKARWGRFNIPSRTFFNIIGRRLEVGKMYQIDGEIEGLGPFRVSHVERGSRVVVVSVRKNQVERVRYGSTYSMRVVNVTEKLVQNIIGSSYGPELKMSIRTLRTMEFARKDWRQGQKVILEIRLRKVAGEGPEIRCFASYRFGSKDLCLWVGRKGLVPGEVVEIIDSNEYEIVDFMKDFEAHRGSDFQNVLLVRSGDALALQVDGKAFALARPYLSTNALRAIFHATIHGTNKEIRFQFDGEKVRGCFFQNAVIRSVTAKDSLLEVTYGKENARTFCLYLDRFDESDLDGKIRVETDRLGAPNIWVCTIDPELGRLVRSRLAATAGTGRWSRERGDISEAIQARVLDLTGDWDEISIHPQSGSTVRDSRAKGPDMTARWKRTGRLYHFELKWWEHHPKRAKSDARRQAREYLTAYPRTNSGEVVSGAMIGILDWDDRETRARFLIQQVA